MQEGTYPAQLDRLFITDALGTGPCLLSGTGAWLVAQRAAGTNMSVDVAAGRGLVAGGDIPNQGSYICWSDAVENVPLQPAPGAGQSRIDLIIAQVRDDWVVGGGNSDFVFASVTGTPATTGSQVAPNPPNSSMVLARVLVGPQVGQIVNANITDARPLLRGGMAIQTIPALGVGQSATVTHNLGTRNVFVQLWDSVTSQLILAQLTVVDANNVRVTVSAAMPNSANVVIISVPNNPTPVLATDLAPKAYVDQRTPNLPNPVTSGSGVQGFTDALGDVWVAANGVNAGAWKRARDVLYARVWRSAALTTSGVTMSWDTVTRDVYGLWGGAGNATVLTAPVAGIYDVDTEICFTATAAAQYIQNRIYVGGVMVSVGQTIAASAIGMTALAHYSGYFNAGDFAQLQVNNSASLALATASSYYNWMELKYRGTG
jgi:hypothetical protein